MAQIKTEWLEIISCCSPKVQMDLIRAIVAWQTDGTVPEFRGTKKAIFLIMVRDLDPEAAALLAATNTVRQTEPKSTQPMQSNTTSQDAKQAAERPAGEEAKPHPEPLPSPRPNAKRKDSRRYLTPYTPLY